MEVKAEGRELNVIIESDGEEYNCFPRKRKIEISGDEYGRL